MIEVKRFIVLAGSSYYPDKWNDYKFNTQSLSGALLLVEELSKSDMIDWWQIIDLSIMKVVKSNLDM